MTSKALKTALATAMLTGNADAFWKSTPPVPTPVSQHNKRVDELDKEFKTNLIRDNLSTKKKNQFRRTQKLIKDSLRHVKDKEGARRFFERTRISDTVPIPDVLQPGDVVKFVGTDKRPGPWTDDLQLVPGSNVEIIEVIPQTLGPPQYLVANTTAATSKEGLDTYGPGGKPILVNRDQLVPAPLGTTTEGFLEDWDKLDEAVMQSKYNPQAQSGAYLPGATETRDYSAVVRDNPSLVGPAWEMMYGRKFDKQSKLRKKAVDANKRYTSASKKGRKTMKQYNKPRLLDKTISALTPIIGETAAATTVGVPTALAVAVSPHITLTALLADSIRGNNLRNEFMKGERKKIWKENQKRFLSEAEMRKLYQQLHNIERGKTSKYPLDKFEKTAKDTMQRKHVNQMLMRDEERKKKLLKKLGEEMDKEDDVVEVDDDDDVVDDGDDEDDHVVAIGTSKMVEDERKEMHNTTPTDSVKGSGARRKKKRTKKNNKNNKKMTKRFQRLRKKKNNTHHKKHRKTKHK